MVGAFGGMDNFEEELEASPTGFEVGVSEGSVADLTPIYDAAIQRLREQRRGLSGRERLGALLLGLSQPTQSGRWQDAVVNASGMLAQQNLGRRKEDEARRSQLERLMNAREVAKIRSGAALEAAKLRAGKPPAPPALAPAAFDDANRALNPFTGEPLAPGTAVDRRGNVITLAELKSKYGVNGAQPIPAPEGVATTVVAPAGGERVEEVGGVRFLVRPDGTRTKLGTAPERKRAATSEEAKRYGATAGQINEATGEFTPSKEAPTAAEVLKMDAATLDNIAKADRVVADIDGALKKAGPMTTGVIGAVTKNIPSTPAFNMKELLKPIQANLGFDELARMRAASPTGGALGQVAVKELDFLQGAVASLEQAQSTEQFEEGLKRVRDHYQRWRLVLEKSRRENAASGTSENKVPTRAEFLVAARRANPGASEAQLNAYYNKKYGSR